MIRSKHLEKLSSSPSPGPASPGTVSVSPRNGRRLLPLVAKPPGPWGGSAATTTTDITLPALHLTRSYCTSRPVSQSQSRSQSPSPSPVTVD